MQRVTRYLARSLLKNHEHIVFVRWDHERKSLVLANQVELQHLARFNGPQLEKAFLEAYPPVDEVRALHEMPDFESKESWLLVPEVTHITFHPVPSTLDAILYARHYGLKSAFIFYDAIPVKLSEYAAGAEAHAMYMQHLALADVVLPISNFAGEDYVSYLRSLVYFDDHTLPIVKPVPLPGEDPTCARIGYSESASEDIVILSIGTLEPRKNQIALIEAFNQLCTKHPELPLRLVLVGNLHPAVAERVQQAVQKNQRISYLYYVQDSEVAALYRRCAFTVYPSLEEGFGLPILESLWHGKPCVCANFGAMHEVARDGGCLPIDVRSSKEIAAGLERLVVDQNLRMALTQEAINRKIKTWDEYANDLSGLLGKVLDPSSKVGRILYWVDHTGTHPCNSGIQRVVRLLARSLIALGTKLVPVKWDAKNQTLTPPTQEELEHLARWSGPNVDEWTLSSDFASDGNAWLLIPELTTYPGGPDLGYVIDYARSLGMQSAVVFYDAIPFKMQNFYPPQATVAHSSYMMALNKPRLVMAISEHSRSDLRNFLIGKQTRLIGLDDRIVSISLPGEFISAPRINRYEEPKGEVVRVLSVGTIEPRKNHLTMIKAFLTTAANSKNKAELTLAGSAPFAHLREEVERYVGMNATIKWVDHVDDAHLRDLYSSCHFTVYPSLEEGFGLPVLESLWHGKPCICRDRGAIAEAARGGGCVLVDTAEETKLAEAIRKLIDDEIEREKLGREATSRPFKTWQSYAKEVLAALDDRPAVVCESTPPAMSTVPQLFSPLLSMCITTYNRAAWLSVSLKQLMKLISPYCDVVELVVCDNASSDHTQSVADQYRGFTWFRYFRNHVNVGMLGNLRETVHHARGRFVWILGDDDIVKPGALEKILSAILEHPTISLIYLNYAYTSHNAPRTIEDIDGFIASATPITPPCDDQCAPISEIATLTENFFTAIYCLIFRRDHAIKAYSQDIVGRPFSSLLTCIPTAYYVCNFMFGEIGQWIGQPCVVVNMNVSWMKYAPLWRLERLPELYELAEMRGAIPKEVERWRIHNIQGALHFLNDIYFNDPEGNLQFFSLERFIRRHKHLPEFRSELAKFMHVYGQAYEQGRVRGESPQELLMRFDLPASGLRRKWFFAQSNNSAL